MGEEELSIQISKSMLDARLVSRLSRKRGLSFSPLLCIDCDIHSYQLKKQSVCVIDHLIQYLFDSQTY
jgi:hypothetical protein